MVDACEIKPIIGETTNANGTVDPTYGQVVYAGKCRIQNQRLRYPSNPDAGEHTWTLGPAEVHIPTSGTTGVAPGQLLTITASFNSDNVGRQFRVRIGDRKTFQSAIRLIVEEVVH